MGNTIPKYVSVIFFAIALYQLLALLEVYFRLGMTEIWTWHSANIYYTIGFFAIGLVSFFVTFKGKFLKLTNIKKLNYFILLCAAIVVWNVLFLFNYSFNILFLYYYITSFYFITYSLIYAPIAAGIMIVILSVVKHNLEQKEKMRQQRIDTY